MPRPPFKRTKLNHPKSPRRVEDSSHISPRTELQQKLANKPIGRVPSDSDDSDKLVTKNRTGRNRRGIPRKEIYASGGVAKGDTPGAHKSGLKSTVPVSAEIPKEGTMNGKKAFSVARSNRQQSTNHSDVLRESQAKTKSSEANTNKSPALGSTSTNRAMTRFQGTPGAEVSILGTIKPRRRQPSILRSMDDNDSSNVVDEDEDDFLPNDESTPLNLSKSQGVTSSPHPSLKPQSSTRKRKLSPTNTLNGGKRDLVGTTHNTHSLNGDNMNTSGSELELPPMMPARKMNPKTSSNLNDDDIMAPPRSSSPLKSPTKPRMPSPLQNPAEHQPKKLFAPSTSALQALMPTRRKRADRLHLRRQGEFEIPSDSNDEVRTDETEQAPFSSPNDDSNFVIGKKSRKMKGVGRNKAKLSKKPKSASAGKNVRNKVVQSTRSPAKVVTPLRRSAATRSPAKSSSLSQQHQPSDGKFGVGTKNTYGSRRRRATSIGDKENQAVDGYSDFPSKELAESIEGNEVEESHGEQSREIKNKAKTKEIISFATKFAAVDEWEMDFEEVSIEGESSCAR